MDPEAGRKRQYPQQQPPATPAAAASSALAALPMVAGAVALKDLWPAGGPQMLQNLFKELQSTSGCSSESSGAPSNGSAARWTQEQLQTLAPYLQTAVNSLVMSTQRQAQAQAQAATAKPSPPAATSHGKAENVPQASIIVKPESCTPQQPQHQPHQPAAALSGSNMHATLSAVIAGLHPGAGPSLPPATAVAGASSGVEALSVPPHSSASATHKPAPTVSASTGATTPRAHPHSPIHSSKHSPKHPPAQSAAATVAGAGAATQPAQRQGRGSPMASPVGASPGAANQRKRFCPSSECYVPHRRIRRLRFSSQDGPSKPAGNSNGKPASSGKRGTGQKKMQPPAPPTAHLSRTRSVASPVHSAPGAAAAAGPGTGTAATKPSAEGAGPQLTAPAQGNLNKPAAHAAAPKAAGALLHSSALHAETPPLSASTRVSEHAEYGTVHTHALHASPACVRPAPPTVLGPEEESEVSGGSLGLQPMASAMHAAAAAAAAVTSAAGPADASIATLLSQIASGAPQTSSMSTRMPAPHAHVHRPPASGAMHAPSTPAPQALSGEGAATVCGELSPHQAKVVAAARAACISEDLIAWAALAATAAAAGQRSPPYPRSAKVPACLRQWHDSLTQPLSPEDTLALIEIQALCRGLE